MPAWIAQRADDVEELRDRTRPAMAEHQWRGIRFGGTDVQKVHVGPVDGGCELRVLVEPGLPRAPVVAVPPVLNQLLDGGVCNAVPVGGPNRFWRSPDGGESVVQFGQLAVRNLDPECPQLLINDYSLILSRALLLHFGSSKFGSPCGRL